MPALFRLGFASIVAYRAEMVIWILSATMPLVMLALWNAVTAEGAVAGFGQAEMGQPPEGGAALRQGQGVIGPDRLFPAILAAWNDIVIAAQHDRLLGLQQPARMRLELAHPVELVIIFRARRRIAIGQV